MPIAAPINTAPVLTGAGDFASMRQRIFERSLDAIKSRFPVENEQYKLTLEDVGYGEIPEYTRAEQKLALQTDASLSARIKGRWVITDKTTGALVSKSNLKGVMDVPYLTERGTFIRNGSEMTIPVQMRLVPGVYARVGEDGQARAHINVRQGTGNSINMTMNPANPVFKLKVGTRNYKLYPLLKHLGAEDRDLMKLWGEDIYRANFDDFVNGGGWYSAKGAEDEEDALATLNPEGVEQGIEEEQPKTAPVDGETGNPYDVIAKDVLGGELDPVNTRMTFGREYSKVDADLLRETSSRLLKVTRGELSPDNRDSLVNQRFFGAPDLISERVRLDAGGLLRNLLWKVSRTGDASKIPGGTLTRYVHGLFNESNLPQVIEETNPLDAYVRATKVTRMGEGGISSIDSAPMSARMVHNSYKGFIDSVASPECTTSRHQVFTRAGWVPISKVTTKDYVACLIDGRLEYHHPEKVVSYRFNGELCCCSNKAVEYEVTPNHRMWTCRVPAKAHRHVDGGWRNAYIPEYQFEFAEDMHNTTRKLKVGGHKELLHGYMESVTLVSSEEVLTFDMKDWCEFLGWYVAEGCFAHTDKYRRAVYISQVKKVNPENHAQIDALLKRMGLRYSSNDRGFSISCKAIRMEAARLGYCDDKYIPETVFMASDEARKVFVDAILKGDGRKAKRVNGDPKMSVLCTTSKRLAHDFERLLFELGYAVSIKFEADDRQKRYLGCYTVRCLDAEEAWLWKNGHKQKRSEERTAYFFKKPYKGTVYCLTVKGGLFYTKIPGKHPFWIGNSLRVGLDTQLAMGVRLGSDGLAYTPMVDASTGKQVMVDSVEASGAPVGFPEFRNSKERLIPAMVGENIEYISKEKIKYWIPNGDMLFALSSNMIPLKNGIKAGRLLMAQKHQTQAVPLPNRMAPYVQTLDPDGSGKSVEERYNEVLGAVHSRVGGTVVSATPDEITVRPADGSAPVKYPLYNHYPLNRKTMVHNTALVKQGDTIKPGQLIARSNYTDDKGVAALGTQLTTAWLPYKGYNYLDGIVISEGAARKLTSEHLYHTAVDKSDETKYSRDAYIGAFPTRYTRDQIATLNKEGVVKPGTVLKKGDPMILGLAYRASGPGSMFRPMAKDSSEVWEHEFNGEVVDVVNTDRGIKVYTKAEVPAQVGDKLAARFANKGTVGLIVPDSKMPRTKDGNPIDVLFSPTGIVSRVNSGSLIEAALGKVAAKTGKKYVLPGFMEGSLVNFAKEELKKAGLTDREDVYDPEEDITIPGVIVGNNYITKFHHTSESKGGARSTGTYTSDEQPGMGGDTGAKSLGGLVLGAVVAHGSTGVLEDLKLIKGQKNTDFWRDFKMGRTPAMPKIPLIYERFLAHLEGSGIHINKQGTDTNIFALTDKDIGKYARATLSNSDTFDSATMRPLPGGLFDPAIFGPDGGQWARIPLDEPIPNPVMEDVIRNLLNLRASDLDAVIAGQQKLPNGQSGGKGLLNQLKSINLDTAISAARQTIMSGSKSKRDKAVKTYRWLSAMKKHDAHPADFMLTAVPVIPPRFRRITRSEGMDMIADANYLYKALMDSRDDARDAIEAGLPDDMAGMGKLAVYNAFKAVTGLGEPADKQLKDKDVNGLLTWVFGKGSPKCHDADTEILTESGFVPIAEYDGTLKCAYVTQSKDEPDVLYDKPGKVIHEPCKGELYHMLADGVDLLVTPDHRCLVTYRKDDEWGHYSVVKARHLYDAKVPFYMATAKEWALTAEARLVKPENIAKVPFDGIVHGVTVPSGIVVVRRNGIISLTGNSGKFQRNVVGGTLDVAGRAVINVDPELNLDDVGLPINQAWDLYRDFIIRRMVQNGNTVLQATKEVAEKSKRAEDALRQVAGERPLHITRAPALHKYSVMAFWPKLIEGDTLKLNSLVQGPYNGDNDGNCCDFDTEIILKSELDNEFLSSIFKVMASRGGKSITKGDTEMVTYETAIFVRNNKTGEQTYKGPIGEVPRKGVPVKDKNGADVYTVPGGVYVLSYDAASASFGWSGITRFTVEQNCDSVEVLIGQTKLTVSSNESLAVFNYEDGLLKKIAPADATGCYVPRLKKSPIIGTQGSFDEGWLHGAFIGDGWLSGHYVGFTKLEDCKRNRFVSILAGCIGKEPSVHVYSDKGGGPKYGDSTKIHFNDKAVVAYFEEQDLYDWTKDAITEGSRAGSIERGSLHKRISPYWLMEGSEEYLWGVFSGLLDSDGSVYKNMVTGKPRFGCRLSTCSPFLRDSFVALCYRLGVRCCVIDTIHKKSKTRKVTSFEYGICPSSVDIQMNLDKIHCVGIQESAMLAEWKESPLSEDQRDVIPLSGKEIQLLRRLFPYTVAGGFYASLGKGVAMRKKLAERLASLADDADDLRMLRSRVANTNTVWDKVIQATSVGPREVFDFCVPDTKVFAVDNGLVIWDTMTFYVPVSDRAVKESVEKMLPSKNLLSARNYTAHYLPQEEIILGAYLASRPGKGPAKTFKTKQEAILAYKRGLIDLNDNIQILEE